MTNIEILENTNSDLTHIVLTFDLNLAPGRGSAPARTLVCTRGAVASDRGWRKGVRMPDCAKCWEVWGIHYAKDPVSATLLMDELRLLPDPESTHHFTVTITGCSGEQADLVMTERLDPDEDYGFDYGLNYRRLT